MKNLKLEIEISQQLSGLLTMVGITAQELVEKIGYDLSNTLTKKDQQPHHFYHYLAHLILNSESFDDLSSRELLREIQKQEKHSFEPLELTGIPELDSVPTKCSCCGEHKF